MGGQLTQRSPVLHLTLVSVSLPGGTRWRLRGKDRQRTSSVMSAKVQVCAERVLGSPESFLSFICMRLDLDSLLHLFLLVG